MYRFVPEAKRELQRMVFNTDAVKIDLESSKMIGEREHLLVLQSVTRAQSGEYKCQVTMDTPPFQFIQSSAYLSIMVLPERHPVISGEVGAERIFCVFRKELLLLLCQTNSEIQLAVGDPK